MAKRATKVNDLDFINDLSQMKGYEVVSGKTKFTVVGKVINSWFNAAQKKLIKNLKATNKDESGSNLIRSIRFDAKEYEDRIEFNLFMNDYYVFVNDGRKGTKQKFTDDTSRMIGKRKAKAKLPPFQPISEWLGKHRSAKAKFNNGGKLRLGQTAKVTDKVKKAIIVDHIRYAIKRNGIEPTYFYTSVVNNNTITNLTKAVATAAGRDLVLNIKQK